MPCRSGATFVDNSNNNEAEETSETVQLLRSMNQNLQVLRNIAVFGFKLTGVAFILFSIVLFFTNGLF